MWLFSLFFHIITCLLNSTPGTTVHFGKKSNFCIWLPNELSIELKEAVMTIYSLSVWDIISELDFIVHDVHIDINLTITNE